LGEWRLSHQSRRENIINSFERRFIIQEPITATQQALDERPKYQRRILGIHETFQSVIDQFHQAMTENSDHLSIIAGSDGGHREHEGQAAHAYTIRTNDDDVMIQGVGPTDGEPMSSYRPELLGLFGVLISLEALSKTFPQQALRQHNKIQVEIFCDNKSAVEMSRDLSAGEHLSPIVAEYDALAEIKELQRRLSQYYRITYTWIKGHQTREEGDGDPRGIHINNDMDKKCNEYMDAALSLPAYMSSNICPFFPCSTTAVCIGERILHTDIYNELDIHINGAALRKQMENK
jgi:ribonuclease HI